MPDVHIYMLKGRTPEQKKKMAQRITRAIVEEVNAPPESVSIFIHDQLEPHDIIKAGVPLSEKKK
jgi:4-oxalocrotonate tautomerase